MKLSVLIIILFLSIAANAQSSWWYWSQLKAAIANNCATYPRSFLIAAVTGEVIPPPGFNGWKVPSGSCFPYNQNQSDSVARCGPHSIRFELRKTTPECLVGGSIRTELNRPTNAGAVVNVKRWYGYSLYLQGKDWLRDPAPEVMGQWHSNATAPDGTSPFVALWSYNGNWWIAIQGSPVFNLGPYVLNAWTDFVYEIQWDNTNPVPPAVNTGYLHVWLNGILVVNWNNVKMGYSTQTFESYMKFGIYKWPWKVGNEGWGSTTTVRVCYYDEIRIGTQNATYNDVSPR